MKTYKVQLTLVVEIDDETKEFYEENQGDLHEALMTSDRAKLTMIETDEVASDKWTA